MQRAARTRTSARAGHAAAAAAADADLRRHRAPHVQLFWETADPETGLIPDRYPYTEPFSSIAAIGFGLTAYGIGVERGYVTRDEAIERTLVTLRFLEGAPQGSRAAGMAGYHGFFYHFIDLKTGARFADWVELSSVDTALLLGGVLFSQSYFDQNDAKEKEIRHLADTIYRRVEWPWMQARPPLISMGWMPKQGYIPYDWQGYNEGMLIYVLALGSPTQAIGNDAWTAWTQSYERAWGTFQEQEYLGFAPLFGHQYSHVWIDFRGIRDKYMRERGFDYFENSRRATYAQRAYAIANPMGWKLYGGKRLGTDRERRTRGHLAGLPRQDARVPPLLRARRGNRRCVR